MNWILVAFKNINPLESQQEKRIRLLFNGKSAYLTRGLALRTLTITSFNKFKSLFVQAQCARTHCFRSKHVTPNKFVTALSNQPSGVNELQIINVLNYFALVCEVLSVHVEMVSFATVKFDDFCKYEGITVWIKLFIEKTQELLFPNRNDKKIILFSVILFWKWTRGLSFDFVDPISILGLGRGICKHLLSLSKVLRKSRQLSTKELRSLWGIFNFSWRIKRCCAFESQNWNNLIAIDFLLVEPLLAGTIRRWDWELSKML